MVFSEDTREDGRSGRRTTDGSQIVAREQALMAASSGIFTSETSGLIPDMQTVDSSVLRCNGAHGRCLLG